MRRFRLTSAPPATGNWSQTVRLPPKAAPAPPAKDACQCAVSAFAWISGSPFEAYVLGTQDALIALVSGTLCAGTVSISMSWTGEGTPTVSVDGAIVRVAPDSLDSAGILSITATLICDGVRLPAGTITLVATDASYSDSGTPPCETQVGNDDSRMIELPVGGFASASRPGSVDYTQCPGDGECIFSYTVSSWTGHNPTPTLSTGGSNDFLIEFDGASVDPDPENFYQLVIDVTMTCDGSTSTGQAYFQVVFA